MIKNTPFLPGLNIRSLRRPARALRQKIAEEREWLATRTFRQIGELCGKFIPAQLLEPNPEGYTAKEIADLYYRRWGVELFFRDQKTTMGMDILRCMTPSMIRKELQMHFIVYNRIRCLTREAAVGAGVPVRQATTETIPAYDGPARGHERDAAQGRTNS